jgi:hypothetical protein
MDKKIKEKIKSVVRELLDEMSSTGAVSGFQTPFAFSRRRIKNPTSKKSKRTKFSAINNISETEILDKSDTISLKEDVSYNVGKDMLSLRQGVTSTEESLRKKYVEILRQKFLGKTVQFQGSKGYGQFKTSYNIQVIDVSIEDWYNKDEYQLILTDNDNKRYFIDISMPIKILTSIPINPSEKSSRPNVTPAVSPAVSQQAATPLTKQINK